MKVFTFGSKIISDAILYGNRKIENALRITNVSPFVLANNNLYMQENPIEIEHVSEDKYYNNINLFEMYGFEKFRNILACKGVIDLLDMRMYFKEYIFEDGSVFRLTCSNFTEKISVGNIFKKKIVSETVIDPMKWDEERLEQEIRDYIGYINVFLKECILINERFPLQKLGQDNILVLVDDYRKKYEYNCFVDRCQRILKKYWKYEIFEAANVLYMDEKKFSDKFWAVNEFFYEAISERIIENNNDEKVNYNYVKKIQEELANLIFEDLFQKKKNEFSGMELYSIGYVGRLTRKITPIEQNETSLKFVNEVCKKNNKVILVNPFEVDDKWIEILKKNNLVLGRDYYIPKSVKYVIDGFVGQIEDIYNNKIVIQESETEIEIEIAGSNNKITVCSSDGPAKVVISVREGCTILIENNLYVRGNEKFRMEMHNFGKLKIGKMCSFNLDCKIFIGDYGKIEIGDDCMFATEVKLSDRIYEQHMMSGCTELGIKIGNHVWGGYGSCFLSGARVGDGCIVGAKAVVENNFETNFNSVIIGDPGRVTRDGRAWNRDLTETESAQFHICK